jgi:arylsulfatase A-like enzyme
MQRADVIRPSRPGITEAALVASGCLAALLTGPTAAAGEAAAAAAPVPRPNIVLIVTDDQRQDAYLNAGANPPVMPNLNSWFGNGGTRFTRASVAVPQCCPSRASLFSGQYAHNTGVTGSGGRAQCDGPFDEEDTLQDELDAAGYRTAIVGKYLNHWPLDQRPPGFDRWALVEEAGVAGGHTDVPVYDSTTGVRGGTTGNQHEVDWIADQTVDYLRDHDRHEQATGDTPFLLVIAPTTPHTPYEPAARHADAPVPGFAGNPAVEEDTPSELRDKPPWVQAQAENAAPDRYSRDIPRAQQRMVMAVDDLIGRLRDTLSATGEGSTLAVFTSDNGLMWGEHGLTGKNVPYTKSIRVPLYLRWPGHVPAGRSDDRLAVNVDIAPTVFDALGLTPDYVRDGRSLLGSCPTNCRDVVLAEYYGPQFDPAAPRPVPTWTSVRTDQGQYVEYYRDSSRAAVIEREFYDLANDPYQLTNRLNDGTTAGDPNRAYWESLIDQYEGCSGRGTGATACP